MGLSDGFKNFYLYLENKYYAVLDRFPVAYKIVSPIDKVFPSFLLLGLLLIVLFASAVYFIAPFAIQITPPSDAVSIDLTVKNVQGISLENIQVNYSYGDVSSKKFTDKSGKILLNVPIDSVVEINIGETIFGGKTYSGFSKTYTASKKLSDVIKLGEKIVPSSFEKITLILQNKNGETISGKRTAIQLSCSNGIQINPSIVVDEDMDGTIEIQKPKACGILHVRGTLAGFNGAEKDVLLPSDILLFEPIGIPPEQQETGNLWVKVYGEDNRLIDSTAIDLTLNDLDGLEKARASTQTGEYKFKNIPEGSYVLIAGNPSNNYASAQQQVEVIAKKDSTAKIVLTKSIKARLAISVVDKSTSAKISNATVTVRTADGKLLDEKKTSETDDLVFAFKDLVDVKIIASQEQYLYGMLDVNKSDLNSFKTIQLEKLTSENSGKITVKVLDEDNISVENALVRLRFYDSDLLAPYSSKTTDSNGEAMYSGVAAGKYYAFVEKYPAFGDNKPSAKPLDLRNENLFNVKLVIGNSDVTVKAFDADNLPIETTSEAEFFNELGQSLGAIPLINGIGTKTFKADKKLFAIITAQGYSSAQTELKQLLSGKPVVFEEKLHNPFSGPSPKIELAGIYGKDGILATKLTAGGQYTSKFKLKTPDDTEFDNGGMHFRVGNEDSLEKETMQIEQINAPMAVVEKGITYNSPKGEDIDLENLTSGNAKWANVKYAGLAKSRDYDITVSFRVKSTTISETNLPIYYRVWATNSEGYERDPIDSDLGTNPRTETKQGLYAEAYKKDFIEGIDPNCNIEGYCYLPEKVYDKLAELYLNDSQPYPLKISAPYELSFSMQNQTGKAYAQTDLYITNVSLDGFDDTALQLTDYNITNGDGEKLNGENLSIFKTQKLDGGNFSPGKKIFGTIDFTPKNAKASSIEIKIVSEGTEVFKRTIDFRAYSNDTLKLSVSPATLLAYAGTTLNVSLTEKRNNEEIPSINAIVRMTRTSNGVSNTLASETGNDGKTFFEIPSSSPSTTISVEAEKTGYSPVSTEIQIDESVLNILPQSQVSNLDARSKKEEILETQISNITGTEIKISEIEVNINSEGLLDEIQMNGYLTGYAGALINSGNSKTLPIPKTILSYNIADLLHKNTTLNGTMNLTAVNDSIEKTWNFTIPLTVNIKIGGGPDNGNCVIIQGASIPDWKTVSTGNTTQTSFEILNNCTIKQEEAISSEPIGLDALEASINWTSTVMGNIELTISDPNNSANERTETLKQNVKSIVWENITPNSKLNATLAFIPLPDSQQFLGKKAQFYVNINGKILTNNGYLEVDSTPSSVNSEITITNLTTCLKYSSNTSEDNVLEISGEKSSFTIDSSACGNNDVLIQLCKNDSGCKGGTTTGGVDLSSSNFTLTPTNPTKSIDVSRRDVAGTYGISVWAMMPRVTNDYQQVNEIITTIEPESHEYFALDRYNYQLIGQNSIDSTTLTNKMFQETVDVKADLCAWDEATKSSDWEAIGALAAGAVTTGLIGGTIGGITFGGAAAGSIASSIGTSFGLSGGLATLAGGIVVVVVVYIILSLLGLGNDCHDDTQTSPLPDFVITLAGSDRNYDGQPVLPDLQSISLENLSSQISSKVNVAERKTFVDSSGKMVEQIGVVLQNIGGLQQDKPKYDILWINATEHIHGDITHTNSNGSAADVTCGNGNFAPYWIGGSSEQGDCSGAYDQTYKQGFHVRIETQAQEETQLTEISNSPNTSMANGSGTTATTKAISAAKIEKMKLEENNETSAEQIEKIEFSEKKISGKKENAVAELQSSSSSSTESCNNGAIVGKTGENSLPKVKFDWGWSESEIPIDACDSTNSNYIYCDATQLGIVVSKKLHALDEFFAANNYHFNCPLDPSKVQAQEQSEQQMPYKNSNEVPLEKLGLKELSEKIENGIATITVKVQNNSSKTQNASIKVDLAGSSGNLEGNTKNCTIAIDNISTNSANQGSCIITGLSESTSPFVLTANISSNTAESNELDSTVLGMAFFNYPSTDNSSCWLPNSTVFLNQYSILEWFINRELPNSGQYVTQESINWTKEIPDMETLRNTIQFKAYLIKDSFSQDFRNDFVQFYSTNSFYNTPTYFYGNAGGQFADYFSNPGIMRFFNKYYYTSALEDAGLYEINLDTVFSETGWRFFDGYGKPKAKIDIVFNKLKKPAVNSPFYYLPFNGNIGRENGRQLYGINYVQEGKPVVLSTDNEIIQTENIPNSNALLELKTKTVYDLKTVNSIASKRGNLLETTVSTNHKNAYFNFSPTYATPTMLKLNYPQSTTPFSAFYQLNQSQKPVSTGSTLTYWTGTSQCIDFSGKSEKQAFNSTPDNAATSLDLSQWKNTYGISWEKSIVSGNVFLKTVFFTPADGKSYVLSKSQPGTLLFSTPDNSENNSIELNGINGMAFNSLKSNSSVAKVSELFELVKQKKVCISNNGVKTSFWWNPQKLYETSGSQQSIQSKENNIIAQNQCIK